MAVIEDTDAVILKTDGSFSVITNLSHGSVSALRNIREFDCSKIVHAN